MFAVLEFLDYTTIIGIIVVISAAHGSLRATDAARLRRLERKINAILRHLNIEYVDPTGPEHLSEEVQQLANNPTQKIQAIKLHREQTGLSLKEAKDAVEAYMSRQT